MHDGFTLRDLVSYDDKHNEANGEDNRDGTDDNRSWNCGVEGPTDDPDILALRERQSRAMLTTLLLSFGVPMLLGGDELGRTQQGNNNAYCQDNEITWFDWSAVDEDLLAFTRRLIALRRSTRCSAAGGSWPGRRRASSAGTRRGHADDRRRTGPTRRPVRGHLPRRHRRPRPGARTARRCSTTTSWSWSTPGGSRSTSSSRPSGTG